MKKIFLFLISAYKTMVSPILKNVFGVKSFCRFSPSCSNYAKMKIEKYGAIKGGVLSALRLLRCQPFF